MVLIRAKEPRKNGIIVKSVNPFFEIKFYKDPIDVSKETAEKILKNDRFEKVAKLTKGRKK
jgi:hypothetical protein